MTPKEKAKHLVKRYSCLHFGIEENLLEDVVVSDYAIESALIAVDEILNTLKETIILTDTLDFIYYNNVKKELKKMQ